MWPLLLTQPPERLCCLQSQKQLLDELAQEGASTSRVDTPASNPAYPTAPYLLLFSLFVRSPTQWSAGRQSLLLRCLSFALTQAQPAATHAAAAAAAESSVGLDTWKDASDEELWKCALPMVRYFGLVHCLQDQLQGASDNDWNARVRSRYAVPAPSLTVLVACHVMSKTHVTVCIEQPFVRSHVAVPSVGRRCWYVVCMCHVLSAKHQREYF